MTVISMLLSVFASICSPHWYSTACAACVAQLLLAWRNKCLGIGDAHNHNVPLWLLLGSC